MTRLIHTLPVEYFLGENAASLLRYSYAHLMVKTQALKGQACKSPKLAPLCGCPTGNEIP